MTDYDKTDIPAAYDRARDHGPETLDLWMRTLAAYLDGHNVARILDLGCGTGRFSEGLATRFDAEVIGLDPSMKMLSVARDKRRDERIQYCRGRAEAIPVRSQSVDAVFISMSLHHFSNADLAARECHRVLHGDGRIFVRTGSRDEIETYPYVPFFRSIRPILEQMLPSRDDVRGLFESAGLEVVDWSSITQTVAADWNVYAEKLEAGADSALARLSREDYQDGLAAVKDHAAHDGDRPVIEHIDLFVFRPISGRAS